ncbi:hypothetical protein IW261DRAFT_1294546, partial [Armillaria novae-zelandiae]
MYLFGSASYGAYELGISDLGVQVVISSSLPQSTYCKLATQLGHGAILCLERKPEFVLYAKDAVATANPQFQMNFNTGGGMTDYVCCDRSQEAMSYTGFFLISCLVERNGHFQKQCSLFVAAIVDYVGWDRQDEYVSANAIMNACKAWRFTETG